MSFVRNQELACYTFAANEVHGKSILDTIRKPKSLWPDWSTGVGVLWASVWFSSGSLCSSSSSTRGPIRFSIRTVQKGAPMGLR